MLTVSGIQKSYGGRTLFADASLQVNRGDRIGLVGPNGAGKSTLFGLILGEESADAGSIVLQRGSTVGYLPQESAPAGEDTVMGLALAGDPELADLWRQWQALEAREAADSPEAGPVRRRFEELDGHRRVAQARKILRGLAFRETDFERRAATLSGGWVMRAHLARLLVQQPDLLLLDEPTNHLDLEALLWLQDYLKYYPGGILLISHDREFLNELVGSIVEIRLSRLVRFRGNYDAYLEQREASDEQWVAAWKNQQREIARLQRFVDRFRAKNTKAAQAQSKLKQIDRMEKIEAPPGQEATLEFRFPQPARSGLKVVQLRGVDFAYPPDPRDPHRLGGSVYRGLDFEVERGQRIVLVGPNGAGKSTLLKLLAGVLQPLGGEHRLGHNVKPGYYSQYRIEQLDENATVLEEALDTPQRVGEQFARTVLGGFLFRGDDVFKRVSVLSGGEKSRLALVKLLLDPPNLLLMDEPTTHLDIPSTDALLAALAPFEGTLVFISHDVYFLRELANHVVHVKDGRVTHYPGGYDYYLDKSAAAARATAALAPPAATSQTVEPSPAEREKARKRREAEARQQRARQRRELHQEVTRLEQEIQRLEARQKELTLVMEQPETYQEPGRALELNREFLDHAAQLQSLNAEWEVAATRLHTLDAEG